jgi:hypothetical protein
MAGRDGERSDGEGWDGEGSDGERWDDEREARLAAIEADAAAAIGVLNATTARLVAIIGEVLAEGLWQSSGFRSAEHWVGLKFGLAPRRAARLVRAARVLQDLPECSTAFAAGEISEDHVGEIVRAEVTPVNDTSAAELARSGSITQLRKALSFLPRPRPEPDPEADDDSDGGAEDDRSSPTQARVGFGYDDDGTWSAHVRGLDPVAGATAEHALRAARDSLFRDRHGRDAQPGDRDDITWADAFSRVCEAALGALDPQGSRGRPPSERYLVNLHIDAEHPDTARIHLGPALPAALRRHAMCDTQVRAWITDQIGNVGLGRRQHVVDPRLRTVVETRDGGCIIPDCPVIHNLEIHHLQHWEDLGPTETWNLVAACRGPDGHHRQLHDGRLRIEGNPDRPHTLRFTDARGRSLGPLTPRPPSGGSDPPGTWTHRSGERADWQHLIWHDPDPPRAA